MSRARRFTAQDLDGLQFDQQPLLLHLLAKQTALVSATCNDQAFKDWVHHQGYALQLICPSSQFADQTGQHRQVLAITDHDRLIDLDSHGLMDISEIVDYLLDYPQ